MTAAPGPLSWVGAALADLDAAGLRRRPRHRSTPAGRLVDGRVNLASNDYLGLAADGRVTEAAARAAHDWGAGAGASRLVTGGTTLHRDLERAIAAWKGTEDALLFTSGYLANLGTIPALVGRGDLVVSDALNHASIVDACRLSGAEVAVTPHGDVDAVAAALASGRARRRMVVVDGVFSMDGDAADLPALCAVAERHGAMVMVDDAHGCGVVGPDGRGTASAQGAAHRVQVHLGTLSKAFGAAGGYVAGHRDLVDWLRNRARSHMFDTAAPPAVVAAAREGLRISCAEPWRRAQATRLARRLHSGLAEAGAGGLAAPPDACIVPLVVGRPEAAVAASANLAEQGLHVVAIRPPSVPPGTARLRLTVTADHTDADVDAAVTAVAAAATRVA